MFWKIIYILFGALITFAFFSEYGGGTKDLGLKIVALALIYLLLYITYWLMEYEPKEPDKENDTED